jgi:type IV pilus assembly protein PilV
MSLIEVLVALVVLSVGMLGIAVMFVQSVRSSRSAILRTQAVNLVSDMADRIRANANAEDAYDMGRYGGSPAERDCAPDAQLRNGRNCDVRQLAEDDLARWKLDVENTLPAFTDRKAEANVRVTPGPDGDSDTYSIRVAWSEPNEAVVSGGDNTRPQTYSYQSDVVLLRRRAVE